MEILKKNIKFISSSLLILSVMILLIVSIAQKQGVAVSAGDVKIEIGNGEEVEFEKAFSHMYQSLDDNSKKIAMIDSKMNMLLDSKHQDIVFQIEKQYTKIKNSPADVKTIDIEKVLDDWSLLPDKLKNSSLVAKYDLINNYYKDLIIN